MHKTGIFRLSYYLLEAIVHTTFTSIFPPTHPPIPIHNNKSKKIYFAKNFTTFSTSQQKLLVEFQFLIIVSQSIFTILTICFEITTKTLTPRATHHHYKTLMHKTQIPFTTNASSLLSYVHYTVLNFYVVELWYYCCTLRQSCNWS